MNNVAFIDTLKHFRLKNPDVLIIGDIKCITTEADKLALKAEVYAVSYK